MLYNFKQHYISTGVTLLRNFLISLQKARNGIDIAADHQNKMFGKKRRTYYIEKTVLITSLL